MYHKIRSKEKDKVTCRLRKPLFFPQHALLMVHQFLLSFDRRFILHKATFR